MTDETRPLTSEELIAAARRELQTQPPPPGPPDSSVTPSDSTPDDADMAWEPPISTEDAGSPPYTTPGTPDGADMPWERPMAAEETAPSPDPFTSRQPVSDPPDPVFVANSPTATGVPPAPPPTKTSKARTVFRVLVAVGFGVAIFSRLFLSGTDVDSLSISDCFNEPSAEEFASVDTVSCDDPHDYEFMGDVELGFGPDAPYPGDDEAFFDAFDKCLGIFDAYVGIEFAQSQWYVTAFYPTAAAFRDGERTAKCALYLPTGDGFSIARGTEVARNSAS